MVNEPNIDRRQDGEIPERSLERGHELRDIGFGGLVISMLLLAALLVGAWLSMDLLFDAFVARDVRNAPPPSPLAEPATAPEPRLETEPGMLLEELRVVEDALLNSYAWTDRASGTLRIPIERAMEVIAERGLPAAEPGAPERDDRGDRTDRTDGAEESPGDDGVEGSDEDEPNDGINASSETTEAER